MLLNRLVGLLPKIAQIRFLRGELTFQLGRLFLPPLQRPMYWQVASVLANDKTSRSTAVNAQPLRNGIIARK